MEDIVFFLHWTPGHFAFSTPGHKILPPDTWFIYPRTCKLTPGQLNFTPGHWLILRTPGPYILHPGCTVFFWNSPIQAGNYKTTYVNRPFPNYRSYVDFCCSIKTGLVLKNCIVLKVIVVCYNKSDHFNFASFCKSLEMIFQWIIKIITLKGGLT